MKLSMMFKMFNKLLPGLVLLLATAVFAANKASCNVAEAVTVNGHRLAPGEYQFQWDGTGPNIDLSILSKGKLIATVPARLVEQSRWQEICVRHRRRLGRGHTTDAKQWQLSDKQALIGSGTAAIPARIQAHFRAGEVHDNN
ncbi:MAG: hypothetical protein DMG67_11735 [Acidobacteria bacterium]|nr:MAG: hypothetical protein DMG67_11735 [Acidobacteriota bacterium]